MRPLELTFKGLRSYRGEAHIDFRDLSLVAILGDTGSGKSSILEAICLALYNSCSWSGVANKPLLADGSPSMHVQLRFSVGGREWTVTRVINRNTTPAVHQLVSADGVERYDGESEVKPQIERLVGLDHDAFLRAVILPQGRFDTLLRAPTSQRIPMLQSILGIDQLAAVREEALGVKDRMSGPLQALKVARAALREDPEVDARNAAVQAEKVEARAKELGELSERISTARNAVSEQRARAEALRHHVAEMRAIEPSEPADQLNRLATRAAELDAGRPPLADDADKTRKTAEELADRLASADEMGVGPAGMAAVVTALEGLAERLSTLHAEESANTDRSTAVEAEREGVQALAALAAKAADAAAAAKDEAAVAESEAGRRRQALTDAATLIKDARSRLAAADYADGSVAGAEEKLRQAETEYEEWAAQAARAAHDLAAAEQHLTAARRADLAASAAAGLHAGDDCPICARVLPDGFAAPLPAGFAEAEDAVANARKLARKTDRALAGAEVQKTNCADELERSKAAAAEKRAEANAAAANAAAAIGKFEPEKSDQGHLSDLTLAAEAAVKAASDAREQHLHLAGEEQRLGGSLTTRREALQRLEDELADARRRASAAREAMDATATGLAERFRPVLPLSPETIAAAAKLAGTERDAMESLAEQVRAASRTAEEAARRLADHDRTYRSEVVDRVGPATLPLDRLAERIRAAAAALKEPGPRDRNEQAGVVELAAWASELTMTVARMIGSCEDAATAADASGGEVERRMEVDLLAAGFDDEQDLADALIAAVADGRNLRREQQELEKQIPLAADYDARLGKAVPLFEALEEVCKLLARSKFPTWVTARRQQTLLAVASDALAKMTGNRFRFTAEFQIFDNVSGQARDPRTLSGGETFLASLALALTLVEMAGRAGRRQESLFLDEGFASLDAECLDDALEVLADQAGGGRLVAVITHLRQVAENLEHVLWVTKSLTGSTVKPLSIAERDDLLADDARSGLVA